MSVPASPILVVCAVIEHDGLILLAQRPEGKRLAGCWEFPGGKVESGEEAAAALHRELAEELSCTVSIVATAPPLRHLYEWGAVDLQPFFCRLSCDPAALVPHEHAALRWVKPDALASESLAPADLPLLPWIRAQLTGQ